MNISRFLTVIVQTQRSFMSLYTHPKYLNTPKVWTNIVFDLYITTNCRNNEDIKYM